MSRSEVRTPLEQPEGHVGEQVDWLDDNGELQSTHILSRDPNSSAYVSVYLLDGPEIPEGDAASDLTPSLAVGWETHLHSSGVIQKLKEIMPERPVQEYFCVPPSEDKKYFVDDNPYVTSSVDEVLKQNRTELNIYLGDPDEMITWENTPESELYPLHIALHTNESLSASEALIRSLIDRTAIPEKRDAIVAALEPLKAFYAQYVEISTHD